MPAHLHVEVVVDIWGRCLTIVVGSIVLLTSCSIPGGDRLLPPTNPPPSESGGPAAIPSSFVAPASSAAATIAELGTRVTSSAQAAALVFETDPRFDAMSPPNGPAAGQTTSFQAIDDGNGFSVSITRALGDCQSSCANQHTWNFTVSRVGTVALVSEQGAPVEWSIDPGTADPATVTVRVVAGPVCPVERNPPDPSCSPKPVPNVEVVLRRPSGKEINRAVAGNDGTVTFSVPGGAYYVEAADEDTFMGQAPAQAFSVPGGRSVTVTTEYDTGIR